MFEKAIQDILDRRLQPLPAFVMEKSLRRDIDDVLLRFFARGRVAVIDDMNTAEAYGNHVYRAIKSRYDTTHITLPYGVIADDAALAEIENRSAHADSFVAVGSGTVSDLVKYASHKAGKPYVMIPTAASMNGYVSRNASITTRGKKESQLAHLPLAVLIDMSVIAAAPPRLAQAGIGDSLARPTAQADWLLSHYFTGSEYDAEIYELIAPYEPHLFANADGAAKGDRETLTALMKLLLVSGFGMTIAGSSAPASGAEHMIAHMLSTGTHLHGEEIAVTAVEMARRQARLLVDSGWSLIDGKKEILPAIDHRPSTIDHVREAIAAIHIPPEKLAAVRKKAGLPESPEAVGWAAETYAHALANARFTRDRFTCLDVLLD